MENYIMENKNKIKSDLYITRPQAFTMYRSTRQKKHEIDINDNVKYSGECINSEINGYGIMSLECGNKYEGEFINGEYIHDKFYNEKININKSFTLNITSKELSEDIRKGLCSMYKKNRPNDNKKDVICSSYNEAIKNIKECISENNKDNTFRLVINQHGTESENDLGIYKKQAKEIMDVIVKSGCKNIIISDLSCFGYMSKCFKSVLNDDQYKNISVKVHDPDSHAIITFNNKDQNISTYRFNKNKVKLEDRKVFIYPQKKSWTENEIEKTDCQCNCIIF